MGVLGEVFGALREELPHVPAAYGRLEVRDRYPDMALASNSFVGSCLHSIDADLVH